MTALIITKDACFARMLYLSLADRNADAAITDSIPDTLEELPNVIFIDAAVYAHRPALAGCDVVIFGYDKDIDALGADVRDLGPVYPRPFSVEKMLDRFIGRPAPFCDNSKSPKSNIDSLHLSDGSHCAVYNGERISLTKREYALLKLLIEKRGQTVSRDEATRAVFGDGCTDGTNVVDVYIKYLRTKLDDRLGIKFISSVRGVGYTIKDN